ncbi:hypothetical protein MLD38_013217 [Melastoma candidum]|uniref:Uncharacterized protein n=1 Tax=Melastoma candidum TaxID=119954 RepID=A0ACB9RCH8_9MYRT|nr:hypothetical protein MLD38_013217 [Melastoma candidum]
MDKKPCSNNNSLDPEVRKGPWTMEEDLILINYIANHGEGVWNSLAKAAGLKRTGKSCRLRWLNYLRPDVRRGNITPEEHLLIMELHAKWGNRWSKIAKHLPGRTDNEIKNFWRTRIQKHIKQSDPPGFPLQHAPPSHDPHHVSIHDHPHYQRATTGTSSSGHFSSCMVDHPMQDAYSPHPSFQQSLVMDPGFPSVGIPSVEPTNESGYWNMEYLWSMQLLNGD